MLAWECSALWGNAGINLVKGSPILDLVRRAGDIKCLKQPRVAW